MNDSVLIFVMFMVVCDNFFVEALDIIFMFFGIQIGSFVFFIGYFNEQCFWADFIVVGQGGVIYF